MREIDCIHRKILKAQKCNCWAKTPILSHVLSKKSYCKGPSRNFTNFSTLFSHVETHTVVVPLLTKIFPGNRSFHFFYDTFSWMPLREQISRIIVPVECKTVHWNQFMNQLDHFNLYRRNPVFICRLEICSYDIHILQKSYLKIQWFQSDSSGERTFSVGVLIFISNMDFSNLHLQILNNLAYHSFSESIIFWNLFTLGGLK